MSVNEQSEWVVSSAKRTIKIGLVELFSSRAVLYALVKRELKSRYRGSFFGFAWALGKPISMLIIYSLIIGEILGASRSLDYYALYLFVGLMFWGFFAESLVVGTDSLIQGSGLIQKVAFPREILPLSAVVLAGVNTIIQLPVLIFGYLFFNAWPPLSGLISLIPLILTLIFITVALTLFLSATNVYVRDVQPLTELATTLLMFTCPIIYSWTFVHDKVFDSFGTFLIFDIYKLNPLAVLISGFQDALWPGQRFYGDGRIANSLYNMNDLSIWFLLLGALIALLGSYKIFLKLEPNFAREL